MTQLWRYRELLYFLVWREVKVRYKQTAIGAAWAFLQPLLMMIVFTLFFGQLAGLPSNGIPHPLFYYSALVPWTYLANAVVSSTNSIVQNQAVVTKVYFPRILLPIATVFAGLVDFGIAFLLLAGLAVFYGIVPGPQALWLPAYALLAVGSAVAAGLWLSALNALYRDVRYAVTFLVQLWMFASPVAYPSSLIPERWRIMYGLNPMSGVIEGFRWSITGRGTGPGWVTLASTLGVIVAILGGAWYFARTETTIADVV